MTYHVGETIFHIHVDNPAGVYRGITQVTLDGKLLPGSEIPLLGDGNDHLVEVLMGPHAPYSHRVKPNSRVLYRR